MIDIDALHALLLLRADGQRVLRLSQTRLADDLGTTRLVVHRVVQRMISEGRIREVPGASGPATRTYEIMEPPAEATAS